MTEKISITIDARSAKKRPWYQRIFTKRPTPQTRVKRQGACEQDLTALAHALGVLGGDSK